MSEQISVELFNHLVDLAALELNDEQADYLRRQLNNQLASIQELAAVPLDEDIPISLHGVPYEADNSALPREDEWILCPDAKAILAQAPEVEDDYIVVPDIPHITLK